MVLKHILVPTDLSAASLGAIDYAVALSKPFGAAITLLHVVEPIAYASPPDLYAGVSSQMGDLITEQRRHARQALVDIQARYEKKGLRVKSVIGDGLAYQEIVKAATKLKTDLVVISTHGRTGISHLFLGSVAERVVRTAPCPVLSIRTEAATAKRARPKKKKKAAGRNR